MSVTSIEIPERYEAVIEDYLKATNQSFEELSVKLILEEIENDLDVKDYIKALEESKGQPVYTFEEVKAHFDFAE